MILAIYGAGGLGREIFDLAGQINACRKRWDEIIFVDDAALVRENCDGRARCLPFCGLSSSASAHELEFVVGVGEPVTRKKLADKISSAGFALTTLLHPSVHIPCSAKIAAGVVMYAGAYVSCDISLEYNVLLLPTVNIGHDTIIKEHSVCAGLVNIGGNCIIGAQTYIGLSSAVKQGIKIGDNCIIGMGSILMRDIGDNLIAWGNPARPIRKREHERVFC